MSQIPSNIRLLLAGDSLEREKKIIAIGREFFGSEEVEQIRLSAEAGETARAVEEVLSYSLFAPCRIVILILKKTLKTDDIDILENYAKRPRGDTPFLWIAESEKETPKALIKVLAKECKIILSKTSPAALRKEVQRRCAKHNITLTPDAFKFLMESCGDDAETTLRELAKILLWAEEGKEVDLKSCERIIIPKHDKDIWAITNAVSIKKADLALQAIDRLLNQGDNEIAIVARLNGTFRSLFLCKTLSNENVPDSEWSKHLGRRGYALTKIKSQSKAFSLDSLRKGIQFLRQADIDLKGGKPTNPPSYKRMVLERLVIDLSKTEATTAA